MPSKRFTTEVLRDLFSYHKPEPDQQVKYDRINAAALNLATVIAEECPESADQTIAIQHVRDARMRANAAVALNGRG